jgi:pimeloyl-ACP methyl ester carboxylesterase
MNLLSLVHRRIAGAQGKALRLISGAALLLLALVVSEPAGRAEAGGLTTLTGTLADGATYMIEVPSPWNGTLLLYSHGYVTPGSPNPARDVGDPASRMYLLGQGFALAGSSYATTGWAVQQAIPDQIAVLDLFDANVGHPARTIAWGHSLGGLVTAGLVQKHPERFEAALPMCGVLAGGVGIWNTSLDGAFAFKTLLGVSALELVHIANPTANLQIAEGALAAAQATPQGRARLALATAFADTPGWFSPAMPEPAATDYAAREVNQYLWASQVDFPFAFALRAELEYRAGGNPSWNTGVNYRTQFAHSINQDEVTALYAAAGLDLDADLATLQDATRIAADPGAVDYLAQNIAFNGEIAVPVLTLHTTGDGLVPVEDEQAYASVVRSEGNKPLLRQAYVHRAGHCTFTPAETIAALQTLVMRLDSGQWPGTDAATLEALAAALGPLNVAPPAYIDFQPAKFPRPFTLPD